jgi:hypothetical protein
MDGEPPWACVFAGCETDAECASPETCSSGFCGMEDRREAFCCTDGTCPEVDGIVGSCEVVHDGTGADSGFDACAYPGGVDYCRGASEGLVLEEVLATCVRSADTERRPVERWIDGDCDGDHCPNGIDPEPCRSDVACPADAGVVPADTGPPPTRDGGPRRMDAGREPPSRPRPDGVRYRGAGGCDCSVARDRGATPGVYFLAGILVAACLGLRPLATAGGSARGRGVRGGR